MEENTLKIIKSYVRIAGIYRCNQYQWVDGEIKTFIVDERPQGRLGLYISVSVATAYLVYLLVTLAFSLQATTVNHFVVTWLLSWVVFYAWAFIAVYNASIHKVQTQHVFSLLRRLLETFSKENDNPKFSRVVGKYGLTDIHFLGVIWIVLLYDVFTLLLFVAIPIYPQYAYSCVYAHFAGFSIWLRALVFLAFLILEIYSKSSMCCQWMTDGFIVLSVCPSISEWMQFFRRRMQNLQKLKRCTPDSLRMEFRDIRRIQVLMAHFNDSFTWLLVPYVYLFVPVSLTILTGFGTIRFPGLVSIYQYMPFPVITYNCLVILAVTMVNASRVFTASVQLLESLRLFSKNYPSREFRMKLRYFKPIGVKVGFARSVHPIAILLAYNFISNNIFTMLVTFPKESVYVAL